MSKARDLANAGTALTTVSATELGYLDGVTSAVQTQIDSKIGSASAINPTIVDAKGDIIAASAADTVARLAVGTNGQVLTAASGEATGLQWATPVSGSMTSIASGSLSGVEVSLTSISGSYKSLYLVILGATVNVETQVNIRINNVSTATYSSAGFRSNNTATIGQSSQTSLTLTNGLGIGTNTTSTSNSQTVTIKNYAWASGYKTVEYTSQDSAGSMIGTGWGATTAAITSLQIRTQNGTSTFSGGTYTLYGVN